MAKQPGAWAPGSRAFASLLVAAVLGAAQSACSIAPVPGEKQVRNSATQVGQTLDGARSADLATVPGADARLADFIRYAVLTHPGVRASYLEWRASVAEITPAGSLPDPRLTFQADIKDTLMSFMPGVMFEFMSTGKRSAMAEERTAASEVAHRAFVDQVLKTAAGVQRAWIALAYANDAARLHGDAIQSLEQWKALSDADYSTKPMMGSLAMQVDLDSRIAEQRAQLDSIGDLLNASKAQFKSALGLKRSDPDPAWPAPTLSATSLPDEDELWSHTLAGNTELAQMRAMVDMAVAGIEVARKAGTPDFSLGLMADLKGSPVMFRPTASLSLPVWRTKISETIAAAEFRQGASAARVDAAQLEMAAQLAQKFYMVRESDRMIAYIDRSALPNLERESSLAGATYQSGSGSATLMAAATVRIQLMKLERLAALRSRENAATDLLLMAADIAPGALSDLTENPTVEQ